MATTSLSDGTMVFIGVLAIAAVLFILPKVLYGDYGNPLGIYTLVWGGLIFCFQLGMVDYDPILKATWWAIATSAATFCLGSLTALFWGRVRPGKPVTAQLTTRINQGRLETLLKGFILLGVIGLVLQIVHLQETIGLTEFWQDPVAAREKHTHLRFWGYLNLLNVSNVALGTIYLCLFKRFRWWLLPLATTALAASLLSTDRTRFFYTVIWSLIAGWYATGGFRFTRMKSTVLALTVLGLLGFFVIIGNHYQRHYRERYEEHIHFSENWMFLAEPYIYFTGTIPAMDAMLRDINPKYGGRFSFSPLVSLLHLVQPDLEPVPLQGKLYHVPMELNTFSYLQQFYQDFGWFGLLLGPWVCGFLSCWAYVLAVKRPSLFRVYLASLLAFCCSISVFVNMFTQEATWFFVLVGLVTATLVETPGGSKNNTASN